MQCTSLFIIVSQNGRWRPFYLFFWFSPKSIGFFHSRSSMAVSNMNLIRALVSQLRGTQSLACGGGGVQTKPCMMMRGESSAKGVINMGINHNVFLAISECDVITGRIRTRQHCICTCIVSPILYSEDELNTQWIELNWFFEEKKLIELNWNVFQMNWIELKQCELCTALIKMSPITTLGYYVIGWGWELSPLLITWFSDSLIYESGVCMYVRVCDSESHNW